MRKLLYTFLALAMMVSLRTIPVHAEETASITITPDVTEVHPGDSVTFKLVANNPTGEIVEAIQGTLSTGNGLTIVPKSANILCDKYFDTTYNDETAQLTGALASSKEGTSAAQWDIMTISCKVDADATVGKKELSFSVIDFRPVPPGEPLITNGTKYTATVNVTHTDAQHKWDTGVETKAPTCTQKGVKTYHCQDPGCTAEKTEDIAATGHDLTIRTPFTWQVDENNKTKATASAIVTCSHENCDEGYYGDDKKVDVTDIKAEVKDATCTTAGTVTFTGKIEIDGKSATDTKSVEVTALGHDWSEPEVVWNGDQVKATRHCMRTGDEATVQTAEGQGSMMGADPTCTKPGSKYYQAEVTFSDDVTKYTFKSEPETIPAKGHEFPEEWTTVPATCEADGLEYRDCVVCSQSGENAKEPGWHEENIIPATGHKWPDAKDVTFDWVTSDPSKPSASVTVSCENEGCVFHSGTTLTAEIKQTELTPAECEKDGSVTYLATVTTPGKTTITTYTDTKKLTLEKLGHKWSEKITFAWKEESGGYTAEASRVCENDGAHIEKVKATVASKVINEVTCGDDGKIIYTAEAVFSDEKSATEEKEVIIPATGNHSWTSWAETQKPTYEKEGKKTRTCTVCKKATQEEAIPRLTPTIDASVSAREAKVDMTEGALKKELEAAVQEALSGKVPAGMNKEMADAIREAGQSTEEGALEVSTELVVEKAGSNPSISGANVLETYDIHIDVMLNGKEIGNITETDQPITFTLKKPAEGGPIYSVMRNHGGWKKIASKVSGDTIIFSSDQFSQFSIISSDSLADAEVEEIPDQTYTGKAITPKVTVTINGGAEELKEGVDYTVAYSNNTEAGTATVTITAVASGRFTGSRTLTFRIVKPASTGNASTGTTNNTGNTNNTNNTNGAAPATGDEAPTAFYTVLLICAAAVVMAMAFRRRYQR